MISISSLRRSFVLAGVTFGLGLCAEAGCPSWLATSPTAGLSSTVHAVIEWTPPDADGDEREVVAGGEFADAGAFALSGGELLNHVARWRGDTWAPMGAGMNGFVRALSVFDADGDGPAPAQIIAAGAFTTADGAPANRIAAWNGSSWSALGDGMNGEVLALAVWDGDGDGPTPPVLIAAGAFTTAGGVAANRIAAWNGATWVPLGAGMNGDVLALASWDADGAGGDPPLLAAGGEFTSAGGAPASRVSIWNGAAWSALGAGVDAPVRAIAAWTSGAKRGGEMLVVGGDFENADSAPARRVATWTGGAWSAMGAGLGGAVLTIRSWTPDGESPVLLAGGEFTGGAGEPIEHLAAWNGATWETYGPSFNDDVLSLASWSPAGEPPQLLAGGRFTTTGGEFTTRIARFDGAGWITLGAGLNFSLESLTSWDPDGAGAAPVELVLAGRFTTVSNRRVAGPVRWRDGEWSVFGDGLTKTVGPVASWDPDGAGPAPAQVFTSAIVASPEGNVVRPVRWTGAAWTPVGELRGQPAAFTTFDEDGPGPLPSALIAVGPIVLDDDFFAPGVASWNGQSWSILGEDSFFYPSRVTVWDADGEGPGLPRLVASTSSRVHQLDGELWVNVGDFFNGGISALVSWDFDGDGPALPRLVAAGDFSQVNGFDVNNIAIWSGLAWFEMGAGLQGQMGADFVSTLTPWSQSPGGPQQLIAGGRFTMAGSVQARNAARWDGFGWRRFGAGLNVEPAAFITWRPDPAGPVQLAAVGSFSTAGDLTTGYFALAEDAGPFEIITNPMTITAGAGTTAEFTIETTHAAGATHRWRRAGFNISDGPAPGGGVISGATTPALSITNVRLADRGLYSCVVTSDCGTLTSADANLFISCAADINGDGAVNASDLGRLLGAWGQTGPDVDVTGDGLVNASDLGVLLGGWGPCP